MANRFAKYAQPQVIAPPSPMLPLQVQQTQGTITGQGITNTKNAATLPFDIRTAKAQAGDAELKLRQDRIEAGLDPDTGKPVDQANVPGAGLSGQAFLKTLPVADQRLVQAMADGRLIPPTGRAAASPYWQKLIGQTLQYDPSFDAIDYGSRYNTRKDFTSGQSSRNIKALNTAIGHVAQLAGQIGGTSSLGGFPFATTANRAINAYERGSGNAGPTQFSQTAGAVASELTQVFRGTGGAEADVQRYLSELDPNASADQKNAAISNIMGLLKSRLDALNDQYTKGMGNASQGLDVLDAHSKKALAKYLPGFSLPPSGPNNGGDQSSNNGFNDTPDPQSASFWENAARNQTPYGVALRDWRADVKARGLQGTEPPQPNDYNKARTYMRQNPNTEYHPFNSITRTPMGMADSALNYAASSAPGAFVGRGLNALTANAPTFAAGDQGRRFMAVSGAEHPTASFLGDLAGTVGGAVQANKMFGNLAPSLGRFGQFATANPMRQGLTADTLFGATSGAMGNPDNPVGGGLLGAGAMAGGNLLGRYTLGPALRFAGDTAAGQGLANLGIKGANAVRGKFGFDPNAPFSPPAPLDAGQNLVINQANKAGLGGIRGRVQEASDLGLPYSLADADPRLRVLAGSAVRKSPDIRALAENTIGPRQLGQAERAIGLIDQHLAPIGDVPTIKANAVEDAKNAAAPLYNKAYANPGRSNDNLEALLATPAGRQALGRARTIAANERRDPSALGFDLNAQGETVLTKTPSVQTLDYVKRGLDDILEQYRDPVTQRLNLDEAGRAIQDVRRNFVSEVDRLHPEYLDARQAYQNVVRRGTAAEAGAAATSARITPEQAQAMAGNTGENLPFFRQGYASALADAIEKTRLTSDPYKLVYGSLGQQAKMGSVFPQGVNAFNRASQFEGDMGKTAYETLGGSPTAARTEADKLFDNPVLDAGIELGGAALTGMPPKNLIKRGIQYLGDAGRLGIRNSKGKADAIGPMLLNTDTGVNLAALDELAKLFQRRQGYVADTRALGGLIGAPLIYGSTR